MASFLKKLKNRGANKVRSTRRRERIAGGFAMRRLSTKRVPPLPYRRIAREVLGGSYELSLVIAGGRLLRSLNRSYRNKEYVPNILSFPLSPNSGEIFLNPEVARRDASDFEETFDHFFLHLFIHGLLHLKGMRHGGTMDRIEARLLKKFGGA